MEPRHQHLDAPCPSPSKLHGRSPVLGSLCSAVRAAALRQRLQVHSAINRVDHSSAPARHPHQHPFALQHSVHHLLSSARITAPDPPPLCGPERLVVVVLVVESRCPGAQIPHGAAHHFHRTALARPSSQNDRAGRHPVRVVGEGCLHCIGEGGAFALLQVASVPGKRPQRAHVVPLGSRFLESIDCAAEQVLCDPELHGLLVPGEVVRPEELLLEHPPSVCILFIDASVCVVGTPRRTPLVQPSHARHHGAHPLRDVEVVEKVDPHPPARDRRLEERLVVRGSLVFEGAGPAVQEDKVYGLLLFHRFHRHQRVLEADQAGWSVGKHPESLAERRRALCLEVHRRDTLPLELVVPHALRYLSVLLSQQAPETAPALARAAQAAVVDKLPDGLVTQQELTRNQASHQLSSSGNLHWRMYQA
mmetsp:Transcript_37309/g.88142  ORF Transcript_37309/g.88142 Transcript_37309/m.88142 type:complete len:420 (+) Transcript_37309:269-1528(+)